MIRTLLPEEQITEPGFYRIPLSRHHNQPCDGVSVTSGILREMETKTPADVWAFHALNPDRYAKKETEALRLGVAMALFVEGGPHRVLEGFSIHEEDKPRRPTEAQKKSYEAGTASDAAIRSVEYWQAVEAEPSSWLTQEEFAEICAAGAVLQADAAASAVLAGMPEVTMAWKDEETGLWVLSRPDTISLDGVVTDYKRMAPAGRPFGPWMVDRRIEESAIDMQLALGAEGMQRLMGDWPTAVGIIAQSADKPYHVIPRSFDDEWLQIARWRNRRSLRRFAECLASGHWPGPGEHIGTYQPRDNLRERLLAEMNTENTAP